MAWLTVEVFNVSHLLDKVDGNKAYAPVVRRFFRDAAKVTKLAIFKRTPRRTGNLQQHLGSQIDSADIPTWARIGFQPLKYAPFVEFGTGIFSELPGAPKAPIVPTVKQALAFTIGGKRIVRRSVKGMKPRAMVRLGFLDALPSLRALLQRAASEVFKP
jgi:hypothetical protein